MEEMRQMFNVKDEEQMKVLDEIFKEGDTSKDNLIDLQEFKTCM